MMSDDESDLTEIDELDDDDYNPRPSSSRSKAKVKIDSGDSYRVRGALRAPRAASYSAQTLYDQIHSGDIDLEPEYQRDVVWPDSKQIGLIDSLFRNFFIPPVIFAVKYGDDGSEHRVCIDGKQRLTSIWRFMDGLIPYVDAYTNERFLYKESEIKIKAKILPEKYRKIFAAKQIICMEYVDLSHDSEREIFQRVQLGMALTPAEKLQALNGPAAAFTRELLSQYAADLADKLDWDTSRGTGFRGLAVSVYCMIQWPDVLTMPSIGPIQKWLQGRIEPDEGFCEEVHTTYQIFVKLSDDKYFKAFKVSKKLSPIEFAAISLLIYVHKNKLTLAQMAEAIQKMRKDVRATETDIRMNGRVMKPMLQYIRDLNVAKLRADPGQPSAAKAMGGSRKRKVRQDDDSGPVDKKQRTHAAPTKDEARAPTPISTSTKITGAIKPPPTPETNAPVASPSLPVLTTVKTEGSAPTVPPIQVPDRLSAVRAAKERLSSGSPRLPEPSPLRNVVPQLLPHGSMPDRIRSQPNSPMVPQFPGPSQQSPHADLGDSLMSRMGAPSTAAAQHSLQQAQLQQQPHTNGSPQVPPHQSSYAQQQLSIQQTQLQQQPYTNGIQQPANQVSQANGPSQHSSHRTSRSPVTPSSSSRDLGHSLPPRPTLVSPPYVERDQRTVAAAPLRSPQNERAPYRERDRGYDGRREHEMRRASWSANAPRDPDYGPPYRNRDPRDRR